MKNITFSSAFKQKYWQESKYVLKHLRRYNNGKDVNWQDFKKLFLINLVQYLQGVVSPNSARLYCAYIKSLLNDYNEEIELPCKEYKDILKLKIVGSLHIHLTDDEVEQLINYNPADEQEHTIRNQFVLSCLTGMRHSDVVHLDRSNIVGDEIVYCAVKTKNIIRTPTCSIIEGYIAEGKKHIYSDMKFNNTIRTICQNIGIDSVVKVVKGGKTVTGEKYEFISSHTARRSFATNLYLQTKDILLVSRLMGHTNIKTTQGYLCCDYSTNKSVKAYFERYNIKQAQ